MLLRARWVLPISSEPLEDGAVLVRSGRIEDVGPHRAVSTRHPGERVRDLGNAALLPGLINAHSHLEITVLRGFLGGLPFFPWIRRLVRLKAEALGSEEQLFSSLLGAAEMIRAGITCVGDCTESGTSFDALAASGLRGVVFQEVFAPTPERVEGAMADLRGRVEALGAMSTDRLRPGVSPHSPYMACPELLTAAGRLAEEHGLPLSLHLAESPAELSFLRDGTGAIADHHRQRGWALPPPGRTPTDAVEEAGWLDLPVPVQLVHLTCITREDLDRLARGVAQGARLGVVACARSNAALGNGLPDLHALAACGAPWAVATDGAPAVGRCDLFAELQFTRLLGSRDGRPMAGAADLLRRVTLEAARTLGLEDAVGSLERGKQADLVAVSLEGAHCEPMTDPAALLVDRAGPSDVVLTMVGGDVLLDGGDLKTIDEERVVRRCRERTPVLAAVAARAEAT